jgi:hypothetical protein
MRQGSLKIGPCFLMALLFLFPSFVSGDTAEYFHDDVGRLIRVINGNERALYQYDEVGNLLAINKENSPAQSLPPVITGINPNIFIVGSAHYVTITGQNLLTTGSITSDNPDITIKSVVAIDSKIQAVFNIPGNVQPGQTTITVITTYGSANISINIHRVTLIPESLSVFPTNAATISAGLTPAASGDLHLAVINKNSNIINAQSFVDILSGGNAAITVVGLKKGTGIIQMGSAETTVFVLGDDVIYAMPVSVSIGVIPGNSMAEAPPVSVSIGVIPGNSMAEAPPISVAFGTFNSYIATSSKNVSVARPFSENSFSGAPLSAGWQRLQSGISIAPPVSVQIESN